MTTFTNRGMYNALNIFLRGASRPSYFYVALVTADDVPNAQTNTLGGLTEIAPGNGYTSGGEQLNLNTTDFPSIQEHDSGDFSSVELRDIVWTASGGSIPSSGSGARYAVLLGHNSTVSNREVWAYWDLEVARAVSNGEDLSIVDPLLKLNSAESGYVGWTNRGLRNLLDCVFRSASVTASYYMALATSAVAPNADTNTLGDLTQIAAGNGYTSGGKAVAPNSTGFPTLSENDASNFASATIADIVWTASGGSIPSSGSGARYWALVNYKATVSNREVICFGSLGASREAATGQELRLSGAQARLLANTS